MVHEIGTLINMSPVHQSRLWRKKNAMVIFNSYR